jgi:PAS domain S-box-containing protein
MSLARVAAELQLADIVIELSVLRDTLLRLWRREHGHGGDDLERALHLALDHSIALAAERRVDAHDQTLEAIDRVSAAAFESATLEELLQRVLHEIVSALPSVDTAAILIREGDELDMRAAIGIEEDVGTSEMIGTGFWGTIARRREPLELRFACRDPMVNSEAIRKRGVLALVGAPLVQNGHVLGVVCVGSRSSNELSPSERQRFNAVVGRTTAALNHHVLRAELTRSEERYKRIAAEREIALAKLEGLLAASPVGIAFLDHDLRYIRINDALAAMNGCSAAAHLGKTIAEIIPDAAPMLEPVLRGILQTGTPQVDLHFEEPAPASTHPRSFLGSYFPVRSPRGIVFGIGAVVTEITEREDARKELERNQLVLESIIHHAPSAIYVKDESGRLVLANQGVADVLGQPLENVVGQRDTDLMPGIAAQEIAANDLTVLEEQRVLEVEEKVPSSEGDRTYLSVKFPVPGPDGRRWLCGISTDITERKQMEDELRGAVRAREDLLAMVSHDMRNPLGTIALATTMVLGDQDLSARSRKHVESMQRAAQRLNRLIDDLLDLAAVQVGRVVLHTRRVAATSLVHEALEAHASLAAAKDVTLSASVESITGLEVECDPERIQRVFENLIGNSIKFCRPGDRIDVAADVFEGRLRFCVVDTGPGIKPAMLPYLFDPYRSAPEHARRGAGLGLFIARKMVDAHGGTMWVESELGTGARFFFTLPLR